MPMIIAETHRLVLRHFQADDAHAMFRVLGDPQVMQFSSGVMSFDQVRRWLDGRIAEYDARGYGIWAVVLKESCSVIGCCGLTRFPDINGRPEIELGFRFDRRFWDCGYATEAAGAARDHAFNTLGMHRLIALIDPCNARSIRVARKLGLQPVGEVMLDGYTHPDHVYAIERTAP